MSRFFTIFLALLALVPRPAISNEPKSLEALFEPEGSTFDASSIDLSGPKGTSSPEYQSLIQCQNSLNKTADCDPAGPAYFFLLSPTTSVAGVYEPREIVNRCIRVHQQVNLRRPIEHHPLLAINGDGTIFCPAGPMEIVVSQALVCYERVDGVYCNLSTACFEGDNMKGKCSKDITGEEIFLWGNNLVFTP